eukprot:CAMPEP_0203891616 /NCGR_PEP_ID=MMETSP0359-20131031/34880_1 /ASSEMBLY_ACC=CAM_ASM_000338 /TAXON_ID=268821 /ORGANISM="Scrippsiella Hangoei, Strain SHTV-5" /LENGTH=526 /DNA_ID=CAMNT_0050813431 /DNA_START=101 /DNA_END=1681 /DNA_ORIENTATION=+
MAPSRSSPVTRKRKRVQGLKVVDGALLGKKAAAPESSEVKAGTGEAFARQAVEKGGLISQASVTKALSLAQVPMQARQNVVPKGERSVQGMGCGLYVYGDRIGVTASTSRFPWLARLLAAFGRQAHPNFAFTSIQVNVNYAARPHVDRNNLGHSQIIGLGDYTGGELWVHDDVGQVPLTLDEDIKQEALYRSGTMWRGSEIDIRGKWLEFTGNRLHYTRAFDGTRYSLVYYTCDRYVIATPEVRAELRGAGFAFSWRSTALRKLVAAKRRDREQRRRFFTQKAAAGRRFGQRLADDDEVVYEQENPKLPGSAAHKRYNKYLRARTVGEARRLGCFPVDLQYDFNWGYLQVSGLKPEPSEWDVEISDSSWTARPPVLVAETAVSAPSRSSAPASPPPSSSSSSPPSSAPSSSSSSSRRGARPAAKKTLRLRAAELVEWRVGFQVARASVVKLAARCPGLLRTTEAEFGSRQGPTAELPLDALRGLLAWAATGRLRCRRSHLEAICDALTAWGAFDLAERVAERMGEW